MKESTCIFHAWTDSEIQKCMTDTYKHGTKNHRRYFLLTMTQGQDSDNICWLSTILMLNILLCYIPYAVYMCICFRFI